jgi:alpha-ribazole phosphatase
LEFFAAMRLYIVRHAQTVENATNICQGQLDTKLSPDGIRQAQDLALRLKDVRFDLAFTSDLSRAYDTLRHITEYHGKTEIFIIELLREQHKGDFQGKCKSKRDCAIFGSYHEFMYPGFGGESMYHVRDRVEAFLGVLRKYENDDVRNVLIMSHGGPIMAMMTYLNGEDLSEYAKYKPKNCQIDIVDYEF